MRIGLVGFKGKMGSIIYQYLKEHSYDVVGFDLESQYKGEVFDCIIDFSVVENTMQLLQRCCSSNIPLIIGTTGFSSKQKETINKLAKKNKVPVYLISNFSFSIHHIIRLIKCVAPCFDSFSLSESHHFSKRDLPSGTLISFLSCLPKDKPFQVEVNRCKIYIYKHRIIMKSADEEICIKHEIKNKKCFGLGVEYALLHLNFIGVKEKLEDDNN